jgi:D-alanyl-D-alanine carboxypeptidase/D-alanyl-D-alanine-endopeptidase (penicillin-binding protein 4)
MSQIVDNMLTVSDDTAAELLIKEIGHRASGSGSTTAGLAAERASLAADGLPVGQLTAYDGSGLDRADGASCDLVAAALRHDGPTGPVAAGLPVAASTGTLAHRFVGTPAAGRVRAKTGTLNGVASLSGFASPSPSFAKSGTLSQPLVFSEIVNGPEISTGDGLLDSVVLDLVRYPDVPPLSAVGPKR